MHILPKDPPLNAEPKLLPVDFPALCQTYVQPANRPGSLHFHDCLELGLCVAGSGVEMIDHRPYAFAENSLTIIPSGCVHDSHVLPQHPQEPASVWKFIFVDAARFQVPADSFGGFLSTDAHLVSLFHAMYSELEQRPDRWQETFPHLLAALLLMAQRSAPSRGVLVSEKWPAELVHCVRHISRNYPLPLTLPGLARECSMSESSFCRMFRQHFQMSPMQYVNRVRLTIAKHLLQTTHKPVSQISEETGFRTLSSFNRLFQREFAISPRQMRTMSQAFNLSTKQKA